MPGPIHTILPRPKRSRRLRLRAPATWWRSVGHRQEEAFRNVWQALRQHGYLDDGTPDIAARTRRADAFVACVIRLPPSHEIIDSIAPLREVLAGAPFVRVAPVEALAITIQELGYLVDEPELPDETSLERVEEFIRQASVPVCDFPNFQITIGGFNSFLDTPFLDVIDDGWCFRIHHRLRDFTLLPQVDDYAYLPHLPLGYYTRATEMGDFPARMARWRDRTHGTFLAPAVDVLAMPTADPFGEPELLHRFELGQSLGAAKTITQNAPSERFS